MKIYQVINYNQEKSNLFLNKADAINAYLNEARQITSKYLNAETYDPMTMNEAMLDFQRSHTKKTDNGYCFSVEDDCVEYSEIIVAIPASEISEIDEWSFLETWMRDYTHSDEIAYIYDIDKVLDEEVEDDEREFLQEYLSMTTYELEQEKSRLMRIVLEDAFKNYLDANYPVDGHFQGVNEN